MQRLLTITELADWLQVPVETIRTWRQRGTGPRAIKIGRHLRYRKDDVERWLEQQARHYSHL